MSSGSEQQLLPVVWISCDCRYALSWKSLLLIRDFILINDVITFKLCIWEAHYKLTLLRSWGRGTKENAGEAETSSRCICSGHGLTLTEVPQVVTWNLKKAWASLYSLGLQELSLSLVLLISMAGTVFIWADIIMVPSGWQTEKES